jgi:hypothetical protein
MNQLSLNPVGRSVVGFFVHARRAPVGSLVCRWRSDPSTGALCCVWTVSREGREPASSGSLASRPLKEFSNERRPE